MPDQVYFGLSQAQLVLRQVQWGLSQVYLGLTRVYFGPDCRQPPLRTNRNI